MFPIMDIRTRIVFGWGSFQEIGGLIPIGRSFVVMGSPSPRQEALLERLSSDIGGDIEVFKGVEPNPLTDTVDRGADEMARYHPDQVIAVGGGSVMDAAKAMALVAHSGGSVLDHLRGTRPIEGMGLPLYTIPTTPGTSSEITPFSVITTREDRTKLGLRDPSLYPTRAIIDPSLTVSLPPDQTAATGFDILSHAFESYWARRSTPVTKRFSLEAVSLVRENLKGAFMDGSVRIYREGLSLASVFAGMAFSNTGTTICHALSYPVTYDTGLPHGFACALSLPGACELMAERDPEVIRSLSHAFGCSMGSLPDEIRSMIRSFGIDPRLRHGSVDGGMERVMGPEVAPFRDNLCVSLSEEDVRGLYSSMFIE
ncbi:MAG: iron-containing alcohol dehydrogenase [Candidatus Thermoplasmatota archaeon]|nr:iron-containing alcohol dehydrogenase [Candidatus Thermoplasmatota archaeon]